MKNTQKTIKLMIGGDVMLGRLVKNAIDQFGPEYPLGKIAPIMQRGDLTLVNLECAITNSDQIWSGEPKAFYFGAPLNAIKSLTHAGVNIVSLANNHILDFDITGLFDSIDELNRANIYHAGAGKNEQEAYSPVVFIKKNIKFGMAAFCDHQEDFAADQNKPGVAYINFNSHAIKKSLDDIQAAYRLLEAQKTDYPILSLHWGPNMVERPSSQFVEIAHSVIEMGYKLLFGHSAHVFQGIEIYHGCPIIYAAGDLVDDYYVDDYFKNDHQLLFELEMIDNQINTIMLYPVFINNCKVIPAIGNHFEYTAQRMRYLCREMGTVVNRIDNQYLSIDVLGKK